MNELDNVPETHRCGFGLTMLTLRPSKALSNVDLPTLGRPTIAANPQR